MSNKDGHYKILALIVLIVLISSFAMAKGQDESPEDKGIPNKEEVVVHKQISEETKVQEQIKEKLQIGIEHALTQVTNENAKQRLQSNLEKFQVKYQSRLQLMKDVVVEEVDERTGAVKIKAKEQVKYFGLFKKDITKTFNVDANGVVKEKKKWYRFLYSEQE